MRELQKIVSSVFLSSLGGFFSESLQLQLDPGLLKVPPVSDVLLRFHTEEQEVHFTLLIGFPGACQH